MGIQISGSGGSPEFEERSLLDNKLDRDSVRFANIDVDGGESNAADIGNGLLLYPTDGETGGTRVYTIDSPGSITFQTTITTSSTDPSLRDVASQVRYIRDSLWFIFGSDREELEVYDLSTASNPIRVATAGEGVTRDAPCMAVAIEGDDDILFGPFEIYTFSGSSISLAYNFNDRLLEQGKFGGGQFNEVAYTQEGRRIEFGSYGSPLVSGAGLPPVPAQHQMAGSLYDPTYPGWIFQVRDFVGNASEDYDSLVAHKLV